MEQTHIQDEICCKTVNMTMSGVGIIGSRKCGKPATYKQGNHFFCRHHSGMQRYIIREGEGGAILGRFNTEKELREAFATMEMTGIRGQRISTSKRRDIAGLYK